MNRLTLAVLMALKEISVNDMGDILGTSPTTVSRYKMHPDNKGSMKIAKIHQRILTRRFGKEIELINELFTITKI